MKVQAQLYSNVVQKTAPSSPPGRTASGIEYQLPAIERFLATGECECGLMASLLPLKSVSVHRDSVVCKFTDQDGGSTKIRLKISENGKIEVVVRNGNGERIGGTGLDGTYTFIPAQNIACKIREAYEVACHRTGVSPLSLES